MKIHQINIGDPMPDIPRGGLLGLDTETNTVGLFHQDFKIRLLQLATEDEAWVFRMDDCAQRRFVTDFLNDDSNSFGSHTDYDMVAVINYLGVNQEIVYRNVDTRMLGTMASPEDRLGMADLDTLSKTYLGAEFAKDSDALRERFQQFWEESFPGVRGTIQQIKEHGFNNIPLDDAVFVRYSGKDAVAVRRLIPVLVRRSQAPGSLLRMEIWGQAEATRMRLQGCLVDVPVKEQLYTTVKNACDYHEEEFGKLCWEPILRGRHPNKVMIEKPISPRSGKKVARYLHDMGADFTGFPLTKKGQKLAEKGVLSVEDEVSGVYASMGKGNAELVRALNLEPEAERAVEHLFAFKDRIYTKTKLEEIDKVIDRFNVVHPTLRTLGTVTGRASSSGPNFQNYSRTDTEMREVFIPPAGYLMGACDYAQIEVRVGAALSGDELLVAACMGGTSFHEMTMAALGLSKDKSKIYNFCTMYGGGPKALSSQTGISYDRCKSLSKIWWGTYKGFARYRDYTQRFKQEIYTISNRRIPVPWSHKKHEWMSYKNLNYFIQSAAREMLMAGWYRFVTTPGVDRSVVWGLIHDEIVICCPTETFDFHMAALERAMTFEFMGIPILCEGGRLQDKRGRDCWTKL